MRTGYITKQQSDGCSKFGIGQTHNYKDNIPMLDGYVRYDGFDSPITQIEVENSNTKDGSRFERWVPIKKVE